MGVIFGDPFALLRFARERSPFYAELYADVPAQPRWGELPVVDPERYWARKAEAPRDVQTDAAEGQASWVWTTGGSTSRSKRVVVSVEDFREEVRAFRPAFEAAGLCAGDRVANLCWAGELSASFILTSAILQELPVVQLPILGTSEVERVLALCRELRPTVLLTFPFVAARLAARLRELDEVLPVAKLLYAGERLHADQRDLVRERFALEHIACFGYGAVDCGPIAAAGPEPEADQAGPRLRPLPGYAIVELLDDAGHPVPAGELGRVTITNLGRRLSPVIRLPIGDLARWVEPPRYDEHGLPHGGAFVLERRAHLSVKLDGWIVAHAEVVEEVRAVGGLSESVQLHRSREAGVEWLRVRVAPSCPESEIDVRLTELRARLRRRYPELDGPPGRVGTPVLAVERCPLMAMRLSAAGKILPIVHEVPTEE